MFQIITNGKRKKKPISVYSITQKKARDFVFLPLKEVFHANIQRLLNNPMDLQALREMFMYSIFIFNVTLELGAGYSAQT